MKIVLVGGGHANLLALRELAAARPLLVSEEAETPYSGMLPGFIAGRYRREECFIDLARAAAKNNADLQIARAIGIQNNNRLLLADGEEIPFDFLALNPGAVQTPPFAAPPAAACPVKPIGAFINWLEQIPPDANATFAVIGGGAGGVETALALARRFSAQQPNISLVSRSFLRGFPAAAQKKVLRELRARNITLHRANAVGTENGELLVANAPPAPPGISIVPAEKIVFATGVAAPPWLKNTGLPLDENGFAKVNQYLKSPAAPHIHIAGDAAAHPVATPKSGVMAVRQGRLLANNILVAAGLRKGKLLPFKAAAALYIIGNGAGGAVATRNGITLSGSLIWRWKRHLDEKFMQKVRG